MTLNSSAPCVFNSLNFHYVPAHCVRMISKHWYCFTVFRSKKLSDRGSKHVKRLRFHPEVEELHYHRDDHEADQDKRRAKGDKMSTAVGLFNPIKFLNSIDQWRIDKFETEIWNWNVTRDIAFPFPVSPPRVLQHCTAITIIQWIFYKDVPTMVKKLPPSTENQWKIVKIWIVWKKILLFLLFFNKKILCRISKSNI